MLFKLGDKTINTKHVHAIGELDFDGFYVVSVYFIGGVVDCKFNYKEEAEEQIKLFKEAIEKD